MEGEAGERFDESERVRAGDYPRHLCIHQIFEEQARRAPDADAVVLEGQCLTYGRLNERANRLAHCLRTKGVGPDVPVGVCLDRCLDLLPALLGILKAGGAYVPLDAQYPPQRLRFMARDTGLNLVLTQPHLAGCLEQEAELLILDSASAALSDFDSANPANNNRPDDLAYVMYTSGSTGTPKGVAIPHRGVTRLVFGQDYIRFGQDRIFLQLAPLSFDASTLEIWGPLLHGGRCVLYPGRVPDLEQLGSVLAEQGVNALWLTSSLFNLVIDERPEILKPVRTVLTGGEALSVPHVRKALEALEQTELVNGYGPTECTTFACCYRIPRELPDNLASIPIGRPIARTLAYVTDGDLNPVPTGVWGDLYIGGDGLARGYVNRPDLTAERFVPDPFAGDPGARLYKTGDICRRLEDGTIEFGGRADDQVKIRGFRIEPGEIESALLRCPGVRQAAVIAREDVPGQKCLAAYVVSDDPRPASAEELRRRLAEMLPDYMVPSFIVELRQLPLTPNGKLDRSSLPPPAGFEGRRARGTAPATRIERQLAQIWKDLLGLPEVNLEDNFFHLGGHSLKAMQALYRAQRLFEIDVPVSTIFDKPTLGEFAREVTTIAAQSRQRPPGIPRAARDRPVPLSCAQKGIWLLQQLAPQLPVYNISWMFEIDGLLDVGSLEQSLKTIVARHEAFRTTVGIHDNEAVQVIRADSPWSLQVETVATVGRAPQETFLALAEEEAQEVFDLRSGPLYRFKLLSADPKHWALLLNIHHLITDGWSMGNFVEELSCLYDRYSRGLPAELPSSTIEYADYSCWQRERIDRIRQQDFDYWRATLAGDIPEVSLPEDYPRGPVMTYRGRWEVREIRPSLYHQLAGICIRENSTLYTVLLAAFALLLHRHSGIDDIAVGTPLAGRTHRDIENVMGFFVNPLVMRIRLHGNPSFLELLRSVGNSCVDAQRHQEMPYNVLVELLNPARNPARNLFFQTMLAYQDARYWKPNLPGLTCRTIEVCTGTSKLDLTLFTEENDLGLTLRAEYNTDLYRQDTVRRFLEEYEQLLGAIVEDPGKRISSLRHISEPGRTYDRGIAAEPEGPGDRDQDLGMRPEGPENWDQDTVARPEGPAGVDQDLGMRHEGPGGRDQDLGMRCEGPENWDQDTVARPEGPTVSRPGRKAGIDSPIENERRRRGTPARTRVELQLAQVWREVLNLDEVYLEDNFFHLGGHSLLAAKLFNRIRNTFNVDLPLGLIFEAPTLARLSELIIRRERQAITGDIVLIRPGRSTRCLFYLPGVGGHTLNFYQLAHCMNIPLPQYGMNLPGFHGDQEPCKTIEEMAAYFIGLMRRVQPEGPYFLCGFSLGGRIAYEMALQLARDRTEPARLYILGTGAPGFPRTTTNRLIRYSREFATFCRLGLREKVDYARWIWEFKRSQREKRKRRTILTDEDFDLPRYRTVFQAGVEAWVRYSPTSRFNGEMVLFREVANPHPLYRHLYANKTFNWDRFVAGPIRVYDIDCAHPDILRQPHVQVCAEILEKEITRALLEMDTA